MSGILVKLVFVMVALIAAGGAKYILNSANDNPIEQAAEQIIKEHTGFVIDLSPEIDGSID